MCAVETTPAVGTSRLVLRSPVKGDAAELCQLANDLSVAGNLGSMPYPYRPADADEFLARDRDWRRAPDFVVEHKQFGFIGMVGFAQNEPGRTEVGYWLGRPFWGRGYATEAVKGALKWAKYEWGRKVVWAGHFADNRASGAVLVKAGFLYTGEVVFRHCRARGEPVATRMMVWLA
jgi:RimJ/RimL family protein N-acetyltransferase